MSIRHPSRCVLLAAALLASCGGGSSEEASPSVEDVKACLEEEGLRAIGGKQGRVPGDEDAPDVGELVVGTTATFIAFYSSEEMAERRAEVLRAGAEELGGTTTRHGKITVIYTKPPGVPEATGRPDERIEGCIEG